jgi:CDP-diacylglycerol--glycerol-3-phosphate 3-phosphatidyltransferase
MFHDTIRKWLSYVTQPVAKGIAALGITANMLTITGLIFGILSGICIAIGRLKLAGALILIGGSFDLMDGAVARVSKVTSPFGALLDSVVDRYSEGMIFIGLAIYFSIQGGPSMVTGLTLTGLALISAFLVSYVRARAEGLQLECKVGVMQRPERVILLSLGVLFGDFYFKSLGVNLLILILGILVVLSHITVLQRVTFALKEFQGIRA